MRIKHSEKIIKAYGVYYEELKPFINNYGKCLMTDGNGYMNLYKKINKHKWYPNPNSVECTTYDNLKYFRPKILD